MPKADVSPRVVVYSRAWRSGSGQYAQGLAEGLAQAGFPVTFIAPEGEPHDRAAAIPAIRRIRPVREHVGPRSKASKAFRSLLRMMQGLAALLAARWTTRCFVITIPDPYIVSLAAIALLRLTGAKIVFVCHDPVPHSWQLPKTLRRLEWAGYSAMYKIANLIVVLAASGRTQLQQVGVAAAKIRVIPHGLFHVEPLGPAPGRRQILAFGSIRRNKRIHLAISAVARLKREGLPVHLVIAGAPDPADPAYVEDCAALAASEGVEVDFQVGFVSDERLAQLSSESDAFVLTYGDFSSQSGVAVMAGVSGRAIITTAAGGIPDLIEAGLQAVVVDEPADAEAVAAAMKLFFATPIGDWNRRTEDGRTQLLTALSWKEIGRQFGALFQ